jgi:hypothetical protein
VVAVVRDALIRRLVRQQRTDLGAVNASEQVLGHSENKMKRIPALIEALYRGHQLANVATWKANGTRLAAMSGFLSALVGIATAMGWLDEVSPQTIMEVSSALVTIVSAILAYLQVATTEKIGLPAPDAGEPSGDSGMRGDEVQTRSQPEHRDPFGSFKS